MTTSSLAKPRTVIAEVYRPRKQRFRLTDQWQSFLLLLPSFIAIGIFVYSFISFTIYISFSNWRTLVRDTSLRQPFYANYGDLFSMPRFQADIRNTVIFTILFMLLSLGIGLTLAILLDRKLP